MNTPKLGGYAYAALIKNVYENGIHEIGRNGTTRSIMGCQLQYDLAQEFPINTLKRVAMKSIFEELMWMLRGQTDVTILQRKGVKIWNCNTTRVELDKHDLFDEPEWSIGKSYGYQIRNYNGSCKPSEFSAYSHRKHPDKDAVDAGQPSNEQPNQAVVDPARMSMRELVESLHDIDRPPPVAPSKGVDQLQQAIHLLRTDPTSRRIIINLWNPLQVHEMALPPCVIAYHLRLIGGKLNIHFFQRSWDCLIGWNTSTAALLCLLLCDYLDLEPGVVVHSASDVHIYEEHVSNGIAAKILKREPYPSGKVPKIRFLNKNKKQDICDYEFSDIELVDYAPHPGIRMDMIA